MLSGVCWRRRLSARHPSANTDPAVVPSASAHAVNGSSSRSLARRYSISANSLSLLRCNALWRIISRAPSLYIGKRQLQDPPISTKREYESTETPCPTPSLTQTHAACACPVCSFVSSMPQTMRRAPFGRSWLELNSSHLKEEEEREGVINYVHRWLMMRWR